MKTVLPGQARRRLDDRKTSPRKTRDMGKDWGIGISVPFPIRKRKESSFI